jgi:uncharacterized protein (DUF1697 family)
MMTTYVALLRAINVAGHAIVKMDALKGSFTVAGCGNVRTYIQSGNVIFDCAEQRAAAVFKKVHAELRVLVGGEPTIVYRRIDELERLVNAGPFATLRSGAETKRYVTFLAAVPARKPRFPLTSTVEQLEAIAMTDLDVFTLSGPKKSGFYGFPNNFIEKALGVPATTRNWSTVLKIVEFARKEASR